jgi:DNA (cytosine-5)-methyltransferase 1
MTLLLDLCCGAGIGADGYTAAGWEVVGVDIAPQPDYPFLFDQDDALGFVDYYAQADAVGMWPGPWFDAIHASPPCQLHTRAGKLRDAQGGTSRFDDLLTPTLDLLRQISMPWVVENVPDAKPLMVPRDDETLITLCGSMFDLGVQRHRLFLTNVPMPEPPPCDHSTFEPDPITGKPRPWGVYHVPGDSIPKGGRTARDAKHAAELMGVERDVSWAGLKEGIPPAYTRWIGRHLLASLTPVGSSPVTP